MDSIADKIPELTSSDVAAIINGGELPWLVYLIIVVLLVGLCACTLWLLRETIFRAGEEREVARKDQNALMRVIVKTLERVASALESQEGQKKK